MRPALRCPSPLRCSPVLLSNIRNIDGSSNADGRTAELLRSIARRGGGVVRRTRGDAFPAASRTAAGTKEKHESPLARLFAAPPPPKPQQQQQTPAATTGKSNIAEKGPLSHATPSSPSHAAASTRSGEKTAGASTDSPQPSAPSRALLAKLLRTIREEKRVPWDAVARAHPEILRMPLYACRDSWMAQLCTPCGATSPPPPDITRTSCVKDMPSSQRPPPPLVLCAAPTGTGKSVLLPLFALDAHWAALEVRLQHTLAVYDDVVNGSRDTRSCSTHRGNSDTSVLPGTPLLLSSSVRPFALTSQSDFIRDFTACSRLCIVVSQPTRVACAELARYTSTVLTLSSPNASATTARSSADAQTAVARGGRDERDALTGKRVGFAVGGEPRFCAETELIYATPGYIVNALQHTTPAPSSSPSFSCQSPRTHASVLSPTTLLVDEAHCRDVETDALLAWMQLSRWGRLAAPPLRLYGVLSATMRLTAMEAYLAKPPRASSSSSALRREETGEDEVGEGKHMPSHCQHPMQTREVCSTRRGGAPILLLSPEQQQQVQQWWLSTHRSSNSNATLTSVESWTAQTLQEDGRVRRAVLRLLEVSEGEVCSPGDGVAPAAVASPARGISADEEMQQDALPQGIVVATAPHRVERFFIDDLDPTRGCFAQSHVLFDAATRRAAAAAAVATASPSHHGDQQKKSEGGGMSSVPLCLTDEGVSLRQLLQQTFTTRSSSYQLFAGQSRLLATLVLQLVQAARLRWASSEKDEEPITILFFLAGIAEMYQVNQSLERLCERVLQQQPDTFAASYDSAAGAANTSPVEVLRSGSEVFSLGLLHASAIGNPQEQLAATARTGVPLRVLLTTNVAENSLTIPNTRIVIDTCLERRVCADAVTGATRVQTAFVSPSSLRQRCGRVGRTCDGVVIHLAPRRYALPPAAATPQLEQGQQTREDGATATAVAGEPSNTVESENEKDEEDRFEVEPLADGVLTVLLRLKYLFPRVSAALAALPSPPPVQDLRVALQQVVNMQLLALPTSTPQQTDGESAAANASLPQQQQHQQLETLLDGSAFTAKGLIVAALPLPAENAALVYHGLQFLCVEDAILTACVMSVPTLFLAPRITAHSIVRAGTRKGSASDFTWSLGAADMMAALSPLEAFYRRLAVQRELAGFGVPGSACSAEEAESGGQLSEPLLLLALLRRWYALSSPSESSSFLVSLSVSGSAMRQVDLMVEQCCSRLLHLMPQTHPTSTSSESSETGGQTSVGIEKDFSSYVCATREDGSTSTRNSARAAQQAVKLPFVDEWPAGLREQLQRSLRRLQRAAYARVHLRTRSRLVRTGLAQWHDDEERRIRLCSQPYLPSPPTQSQRRGGHYRSGAQLGGRGAATAPSEADDHEEAQQRLQRAVRRHPSFLYWGKTSPQAHQSQKQFYPSLTTPPPVKPGVSRARSPTYRPPPPPPSPPSVAFVLGRSADRLSAAFVAAFGHRTMRGEDGGHRFHHRRLVRNQQALEQDADHACTASLEIHSTGHRANSSMSSNSSGETSATVHRTGAFPLSTLSLSSPPTYETLEALGVTPDVVHAALAPYLRGTGLQQVEIFQSNRLALALRFAASGFEGLEERGGINTSDISSPSSAAGATSMHDISREGDEEEDGGDFAGHCAAGLKQRGVASDVEEGQAATASTSPAAVAAAAAAVTGRASEKKDRDASELLLLQPLPLSVLRPNASQQTEGAPPTRLLTTSTSTAAVPGGRVRRGNPYVHLAPFGVSLLIAAAAAATGSGGSGLGGLQRIPLPVSKFTPQPTIAPPNSMETAVKAEANTRRAAETSSTRTLHFFSADKSRPSSMCVSWSDNFSSRRRTLQREDVAALGLGDLFPTPPPPLPAAKVVANAEVVTAASSMARDEKEITAAALDDVSGNSASLTLSITHPIYIARSITWKVPLPCAIHLPPAGHREAHRQQPRHHHQRHHSHTRARPSLHYCVLCQQLCSSRLSFAQHCRSNVHVEHLYHAVRVGLSRARLEQLYGYPAQASTKRDDSNSSTTLENTRSGEERCGEDGVSYKKRDVDSAASLLAPSAVATAALPLLSLFSLDTDSNSTHGLAEKGHHLQQLQQQQRQGVPPAPAPLRLLTQQLHPCVMHSLSLLNCLQWTPRRASTQAAATATTAGGDAAAGTSREGARQASLVSGEDVQEEAGERATPLAVAGGLVATSSAADILPPPHLRPRSPTHDARSEGSPTTPALSSTLAAHHVWVLDVSSSSSSSSTARSLSASAPATPPPMSLLFVLAGYIAAASPQAMIAFLFDASHTHLHGVMVYGLGAWRLPQPLPMNAYSGVLEHVGRGGSWPGLLIPIHGRGQEQQEEQQAHEEEKKEKKKEYEGLHWCVPARQCAMCQAGSQQQQQQQHGIGSEKVTVLPISSSSPDTTGTVGEETRQHWPMVEAALLLVLQEYVQARRNMVTLASYVERVLLKLHQSPLVVHAADLLADFMSHARGGQGIQSLLRDVGCVFVTPPHALTALLNVGSSCEKEEEDKNASGDARGVTSGWTRRLSTRALGAEGAAVEVMFTVPPVLPSALPPPNFAALLRRFYENRQKERWRAGEKSGGEAEEHEERLGQTSTAAASKLKRAGASRAVDGGLDDRLLF